MIKPTATNDLRKQLEAKQKPSTAEKINKALGRCEIFESEEDFAKVAGYETGIPDSILLIFNYEAGAFIVLTQKKKFVTVAFNDEYESDSLKECQEWLIKNFINVR